MTDPCICPFCPDNWINLEIVARSEGGSPVAITPLRPVTEGHLLVIDASHTSDAAVHPGLAAELMRYAAALVRDRGIEANIITSIGANATQTVRHTHLHIIPRRLNDGLALPWTGQYE